MNHHSKKSKPLHVREPLTRQCGPVECMRHDSVVEIWSVLLPAIFTSIVKLGEAELSFTISCTPHLSSCSRFQHSHRRSSFIPSHRENFLWIQSRGLPLAGALPSFTEEYCMYVSSRRSIPPR